MRKIADYRSDKVARPTSEMVRAMAKCRWGNGIGEDGPTVEKLERLAAKITGKESALFVASGTLSNQLAVLANAKPGQRAIVDDHSHIWSEAGSSALLATVKLIAVPSVNGVMRIGDVREALGGDRRKARPVLVCTENTHNFGGGRVMSLTYLRRIRALAHTRGAKVYMDAARIVNASVKSGIPVAKFAATADCLMFCLSKGLCAPAGSILCGDAEFIKQARDIRDGFGAAIKQPGPLAQCGIIALTKMVGRLKVDHQNAARLLKKLGALPGIARELTIDDAETNMVFMTLKRRDGDRFLAQLARQRVLGYHLGRGWLRFAVHRDIDRTDVDRTVAAFAKVLGLAGRRR